MPFEPDLAVISHKTLCLIFHSPIIYILYYKYFAFSQISPDPLEFPHRYKNYHDIEISAFVMLTRRDENNIDIAIATSNLFKCITSTSRLKN